MENPLTYEESGPELTGNIGIGALSLIAANAGLIFLYLVYDLTLTQLVMVYWLESLWIGIFCALKLVTASIIGDPYENRWVSVSAGAGVLTSLVSIGIVGGEFLSLFAVLGAAIAIGSAELTGLAVSRVFFDQIGLMLGISAIFIAGHGISFVANFLLLGEYKTARVGVLLTLPFKRCFALMGATIVAFAVAFSVPGLGNSTGFAVILITCKLMWDYRLHKKERRDMRRTTVTDSTSEADR